MTHDDVQAWLDSYIEAWRTYDPAGIKALFSGDAAYRYHPWDTPLVGARAIAADWMDPGSRDAPGTWEARYEPYAVDGDRAVAVGVSRYFTGPDRETTARVYHNVFLLRFDGDGRCTSFTELFGRQPDATPAPA